MLGLILNLFATENYPTSSCNLMVKLENIEDQKGQIMIAVYDSEKEFPNGKGIAGKKAGLKDELCFKLSPGRYAIAVYHDLNNNERLDKNMLGIPKEAFGFSNNPKITTGAPSFDKAAVTVTNENTTIVIRLKKFL